MTQMRWNDSAVRLPSSDESASSSYCLSHRNNGAIGSAWWYRVGDPLCHNINFVLLAKQTPYEANRGDGAASSGRRARAERETEFLIKR